jgi:hypothetical protein
MRYLITALTVFAAATALYATASAQPSALTRIGDDRTYITVDTAAGTVQIFIDGQEHAIIDKEGLNLRGDLRYSGNTGYTNKYEKQTNAP